MRFVAQHDRREGPEAFAKLDLEVHRRLHLRRPGVAKNAASPKRPRSKLHPSLKPTDHFLRSQKVHGVPDQFRFISTVAILRAKGVKRLPDLRAVEGGTEQTSLLGIRIFRRPWIVEQLIPHEQGRAQSASGIAGGWLHPDVLEWSLAQKTTVGHTVEGNTAKIG